ncbi:MFS transporter [Polycladidibacter hongkongensis]|uniref:MFS transporter n=1 Tax=Polycladidibacter hongkongensis TaxID=1647556 RepID=UPI0008376459|nr:MFS transporter [Pseudovibrio hongkongensis]
MSSTLKLPPLLSGSTLALALVCGSLVSLLSFGPRASLGLFLTPMSDAHQWSRDVFALALAIQNLVWGLAQPFAGAAADKLGSGKTIACGGVLYAIGLYLMSMSGTPLLLHLTAGVLIGLGIAFSSFTLVLAAFAKTVPAHRQGLAFGLGTAAGSFGQFLFAPLGQGLISNIGWQPSLWVLAAITCVIPLLALVMALIGNPTAAHKTAAAKAEETARAAGVQPIDLKQTLATAFKTRSYQLLVAGFFVCGFHVAFITVHLPPYLADLGMDPALGAWALALIGLCNIVGSLVSGYCSSHYPKPYVLSFIYFARALAILAFISMPVSPTSVLLFAGTMGLLWLSTVPPTSGLVAVMFGPKYMGTLFGLVFLSHQIGSFLGVWLGGVIYAQTGSYLLLWWAGIALGVLAAIVHWPIAERHVPVGQPANSGVSG